MPARPPLPALVRLALALCAALLAATASAQTPAARTAPPPASAVATFAGGCFWCMEPPFDKLDGVLATTSGYMGGKTRNPTYAEVSAGVTGHAEVVQVRYDPSRVGYERLLEVFWRNIDPTVGGPPVLRRRQPVPQRDLRPRRGAAAGGGSVARRAGENEAVQGPDRHTGARRRRVLAGRGLPSGLLREEPDPLCLLPQRLRARPAARRPLGQRPEIAPRGPARAEGPLSAGTIERSGVVPDLSPRRRRTVLCAT